jgi:predicted glycoside hydrolase/deacetylase ChbG (UPF0249 family)
MKRLIISADDFGYCDGVVQGIIELHQGGLITSTSCMTNMPAWPQAAAHLREHPELGAGVHLVINEGQPVLPAGKVQALLGDDGQFLNDGQIIRSLRPGTTAQLRAELRAQIERFAKDVGRLPDHLDSHCAVSYVRPDRFNVALELAAEYELPIRFPFGDDLDEIAKDMSRIWGYPTWPILGAGWLYRRRVDRAGIHRPNTFIQSFSPNGPRTPEHLLSIIDRARDGWISEILTHPGYDGDWREAELAAFRAPQVRERLNKPDIELVSFAAVSQPGAPGL